MQHGLIRHKCYGSGAAQVVACSYIVFVWSQLNVSPGPLEKTINVSHNKKKLYHVL